MTSILPNSAFNSFNPQAFTGQGVINNPSLFSTATTTAPTTSQNSQASSSGFTGSGFAGSFNIMQSMMMMMQQMFQMMWSYGGGATQNQNQNYYYPPTNSYPNPSYPTPTPPPSANDVRGSAGLVGDPRFMLFTPQLQNDPRYASLMSFDSGIRNGQSVVLLQDPDRSGFEVSGTGIQVNPANGNSIGIGEVSMKIANHIVQFKNNGNLVVDGQVRGNLNADGMIAPIVFEDGSKIFTDLRVDDANGTQRERFVVKNGEYEVTAALRRPHPDSNNYYDLNFAELSNQAASNATGYRSTVNGFGQVGIADLLRIEPTRT